MLAVDTNVLVRLVTRDDPDQARRAFALFERERLWIGKTVLLETEWVLRYSYRLNRETILKALRGVVGLENVELEDPRTVARALDWFEAGLDFADALHLATGQHTDGFISFDQRLIKRAARLKAVDLVKVRSPAGREGGRYLRQRHHDHRGGDGVSVPTLQPDRLRALLKAFKEQHGARYHLQSLGYFGSYARNEANSESDVDIVFTTDHPDLFMTAMLKQDLEALLNRPVDVVRLRNTMNPRLKARIERDATYV